MINKKNLILQKKKLVFLTLDKVITSKIKNSRQLQK
jgi:hypothetical protein